MEWPGVAGFPLRVRDGSCAERPFPSTRSVTPLKPTGVSFTDGIHLMPFRAPIVTSPALLSSYPRQQRLWRSPRSTSPLIRDPDLPRARLDHDGLRCRPG